jgi:hypothetical protein
MDAAPSIGPTAGLDPRRISSWRPELNVTDRAVWVALVVSVALVIVVTVAGYVFYRSAIRSGVSARWRLGFRSFALEWEVGANGELAEDARRLDESSILEEDRKLSVPLERDTAVR